MNGSALQAYSCSRGENLSREDNFSPLGNDTSDVIMVVCFKADKKQSILTPASFFPI